jgi:hypothetical protein
MALCHHYHRDRYRNRFGSADHVPKNRPTAMGINRPQPDAAAVMLPHLEPFVENGSVVRTTRILGKRTQQSANVNRRVDVSGSTICCE